MAQLMQPKQLSDQDTTVELDVRPHESASTLLGVFAADAMPKGFSIELDAEADKADAEITKISLAKRCEFIVSIINNSDELLHATVQRL